MVSRSRSRMIVANAAVALRRSRFASRYGRSTSPARAGRSALAANPMSLVRSALLKCTRPIGWSRYCQRSARNRYAAAVVTSASSSRPTRARASSVATAWKSVWRRNSASRPTAAASAIPVRRCCRISDERRGARRERLRRPKPAARNYMTDPRHLLPFGSPEGTARVSLAPPLTATRFPTLTRFRTGKVRDVYDLGHSLLIVATDRISAFDYVLGSGIPDKGKVLTQLSAFWFDR